MVINFVLEQPPKYGTVVDYDGLWKKLIYELFEEFVLFFAADLYEDVDFSQETEFLQQELFQEIIQEKKGRQVADQIVKVCLKNGQEQWVLIHIEVQGSGDTDFAKRMFRYYYKIFDKYNHDIVAIALLTDDSKHFRPSQYEYASYGTSLIYNYNMYKFSDHDEEELLNSNNPFAIAVLAANYANEAKHDDLKRYRFKSKLMRLLLKRSDYPREQQRIYISTLIYFIDYLLQIPEELTEKLREEFILTKEDIAMLYIDRNNPPPTWGEMRKLEMEEVTKKSKIEIAKRMLNEGLSFEMIAKLTELPIKEIQNLNQE